MADGEDDTEVPPEKSIAFAARATIELFGNGAVAKTRERLGEVEVEGDVKAITYWRALLKEVTRLHKRRHKY